MDKIISRVLLFMAGMLEFLQLLFNTQSNETLAQSGAQSFFHNRNFKKKHIS